MKIRLFLIARVHYGASFSSGGPHHRHALPYYTAAPALLSGRRTRQPVSPVSQHFAGLSPPVAGLKVKCNGGGKGGGVETCCNIACSWINHVNNLATYNTDGSASRPLDKITEYTVLPTTKTNEHFLYFYFCE